VRTLSSGAAVYAETIALPAPQYPAAILFVYGKRKRGSRIVDR
jgi:hypothetical protein